MSFLRWIDENLMLNKALYSIKNLYPPWDHFRYTLGTGTFGPDRGLAFGCRQTSYVTRNSVEATLQTMKSDYIRIASDKNYS